MRLERLWHCVSENKNNIDMDITKNLKSVLIIDDNHEEIQGLESVLGSVGVYFKHYTPENLHDIKIKNHQIIFMDFILDDSKNDIENISLIRRTLKTICNAEFGSYGLVLWTKHIEYIDLFKEKLSEDAKNNRYITPLFIVGLDKIPYLRQGYETLWDNLNAELRKDKAATFFFNWRNSVELGVNKALNDIYQLVPDYKEQNIQFPYMLYQIAQSYSGVPVKGLEVYDGMYKDVYRAFDELLYSDLISQQCEFEDIFSEITIEKPNYTFDKELVQISKINSKLLIDFSFNNQNFVMPGNVYQIVGDNAYLKFKDLPKKHNTIPIAIELTPPCDFSNKKISSRLIGGFMMDCPMESTKLLVYVDRTFKADSKYLIWPINYEGVVKFICFDFRYVYIDNDESLKNTSSYKLLFMVKHRLFADILQKFSSHAARLGLSVIQPAIK